MVFKTVFEAEIGHKGSSLDILLGRLSQVTQGKINVQD